MKSQFPPLFDSRRFPLLHSQTDEVCARLMGCDDLKFWALEDNALATYVTRMPGVEWHLYGDTRWPSGATWVEFPLTNYSRGWGGVLLLVAEIPEECEPFSWIAENHPLAQIEPKFRLDTTVEKIDGMLHSQAASREVIAGPEDLNPAYVHGYCIFKKEAEDTEPEFAGFYTDVLNRNGIPIPKFRLGDFRPEYLRLCQFSLHALFRLNEARRAGKAFCSYAQNPEFAPVQLGGDEVPPKWFRFHPSRTLRARPELRALPTPALTDGVMHFDDFERVMAVRRRELNSHMLAFDRLCRPREMGLMIHRSHGGAIYAIPERLVEEFDHTDCSEVRVADISLPFASVFLKFTPPKPIMLAGESPVDGCYIVRQGEEFLFELTSRLLKADYANSMSVACVDSTFTLHLPFGGGETTINESVELGIEGFLADNAPPEEDESTTIERPDGTVSHVIDVRAASRKRRIDEFRSQEPAFRACLNIIVNAACFIGFRPDDITDDWEGEPPGEVIEAASSPGDSRRTRDRKIAAIKKIENGDYTRIKICGRNLFDDIIAAGSDGTGTSPRAHWRRGHWRRQRHGVGLSLIALRWIRPTIVKKDNGPLVEARIYDVEDKEADLPGAS